MANNFDLIWFDSMHGCWANEHMNQVEKRLNPVQLEIGRWNRLFPATTAIFEEAQKWQKAMD